MNICKCLTHAVCFKDIKWLKLSILVSKPGLTSFSGCESDVWLFRYVSCYIRLQWPLIVPELVRLQFVEAHKFEMLYFNYFQIYHISETIVSFNILLSVHQQGMNCGLESVLSQSFVGLSVNHLYAVRNYCSHACSHISVITGNV